MSNAVRSNKTYVDSTGAVTTDRTKINYILFTPSTADDSMTLRETSSDVDILFIQGATAKQTLYFRFDEVPLVFTNGIYIQQISSGAKALLVTTSGAS